MTASSNITIKEILISLRNSQKLSHYTIQYPIAQMKFMKKALFLIRFVGKSFYLFRVGQPSYLTSLMVALGLIIIAILLILNTTLSFFTSHYTPFS